MMKKTQDLNLFGEALVVKYWPMALVFLLVFIPVSFFHNNDQLSGWLQTFDLAILIAIYFYFKKTRKPAPLGHALTFLGIPILVGWLINGGPDNMGLWWTLVYTVWVFLLNSTKWAFRWSLIFVSVMVLTYLLSKPFHYPIAYTTTTLLNLSFAYVFTTLLLLFFHLATTHYFGLFESELEERKEAEEKLEKLAMIINASSDAIFSKGKNNLILTWNPGAEKIFGYKAEEIIGQSGLVLIPKHLEDEESTIISKVLNGAQLEHFETFRLKKDGTRMAVSLNYSPILEKNGDVDSISVVLRDITVQKDFEEKFNKISILEAKSKEMEEFSYIISHDLRHPLLTVLSYIKIFKEDFGEQLNEEANHMLRTIVGAATRMDKLINSLLDYSRLSKIKKSEKVDCNVLLQNVLSDLDTSIKNTSAKISYEDLPTVQGFPLELGQLFQNLITNGIKFVPKGKTPEIHISAKKTGKSHVFAIKDNGIGIDEANLNKIFVIFQKLHAPTDYDGVGIGLAFCKKIAELHGGKIWVESYPNDGSTFYFDITI